MIEWFRAFVAISKRFADHEQRLIVLEKQEKQTMATLDDVKAQIDALVAEDSVVVNALNDLKSKVDAGGTVTSADLDGIQSSIQAEVAKLNDAVTAADPDVSSPS